MRKLFGVMGAGLWALRLALVSVSHRWSVVKNGTGKGGNAIRANMRRLHRNNQGDIIAVYTGRHWLAVAGAVCERAEMTRVRALAAPRGRQRSVAAPPGWSAPRTGTTESVRCTKSTAAGRREEVMKLCIDAFSPTSISE